MITNNINLRIQELNNDLSLDLRQNFNINKKDLLDYAFQKYNFKDVAELGCVWGVEGAYGQYVAAKYNPTQVNMVDTHWTEESLRLCAKHQTIQTYQRNFADYNLPGEIGKVDTIILFDVLLHQVAPDWRTVLQMYAPYTDSLIIYNQQFTASPITVRLLDLGYDEYFNNVPHPKGHPTYESLFTKMYEINPEHNRIWRDVHHVWQWGITDHDLISTMEQLGFQLDYLKNHGQFHNLKNFENHAFLFRKKE
jgi:hypothetical protein